MRHTIWNRSENVGEYKTLEPCPFCGYRPRINITVSRFGKVGDCIAINLICDECNIRKTVHIRDGTELEDVQDAINKTIDDWNLQAKGAMRLFDNKWLECGKIMPPDGEYILIFDGRKVLQAIYYKSINGYWISGELFIEGKDITHWMPFPDPPIKEAQNES